MRRRGRGRRVGKWAGLAACAFVAATWIVTGWWRLQYYTPAWEFNCGVGWFGLVIFEDKQNFPPDWSAEYVGGEFRWGWVDVGKAITGDRWINIPIWLALFAIAVPTVILWQLDRRPPPGHCQRCGYDLTGNVSGQCPECGSATESAS